MPDPAAGAEVQDPPRPAATVAILRDGPRGPEVLLTHRPSSMAFGPGLHVFPGGALDPDDADRALLSRLLLPLEGDPAGLHGAPFVIAAIREAWEETGVLLASGDRLPAPDAAGGAAFRDLVLARDVTLRGDWVVPLSRWVTPPVVARRYDARFFVAWLPEGATPVFDAREVASHDWLTPPAALEAMADRRIELWMPTSTTLQQLAGVRDLADVRSLAPVRAVRPPRVEPVAGTDGAVTRVVLDGAGGVPGTPGTASIIGRRRVVVVDPGDPSDEAADAILGAVVARGGVITAIVVTAPIPARAGGAEGLALRLGVPVLAPAGAERVLACGIVRLVPGDVLDVDVPLRVLVDPVGGPGAILLEPGPG